MRDSNVKKLIDVLGEENFLKAFYGFYVISWIGRKRYCGFIQECLYQYLIEYPSRKPILTAVAKRFCVSPAAVCKWLKKFSNDPKQTRRTPGKILLKNIFDETSVEVRRPENS